MNNKLKFRISLLVAVCLLGLFGVVLLFRLRRGSIYSKTDIQLFSLINIHATRDITTLVVHRNKYRGVIGKPPYYLPVPHSDSILFVTRDGPTAIHFHIYDLIHNRDVAIASIEDFGNSIGETNSTWRREWVECNEPGKLLVFQEINDEPKMKTQYQLNVNESRMDSIDTVYYDANGKVTDSDHGPGR